MSAETKPFTPEEQAARDGANLRSLLENDVPPGLEELLGSCRPFTGATLALMQQTRNEWLRRVTPAEMENHYFATLAWLFIQSAPEKLVRRVVWDIEDFRAAVLDWSTTRVTPDQLAAADAIIQQTLGLVDAANFSVEAKPNESGTTAETPPPNS
jgi:hypothetical protein